MKAEIRVDDIIVDEMPSVTSLFDEIRIKKLHTSFRAIRDIDKGLQMHRH